MRGCVSACVEFGASSSRAVERARESDDRGDEDDGCLKTTGRRRTYESGVRVSTARYRGFIYHSRRLRLRRLLLRRRRYGPGQGRRIAFRPRYAISCVGGIVCVRARRVPARVRASTDGPYELFVLFWFCFFFFRACASVLSFVSSRGESDNSGSSAV